MMRTLYIENTLKVMVNPGTQAHLDGHMIVAYTCSISRDNGSGNPLISRSKESALHLEEMKDLDYCNFITFESDQ
nr:hypothetical protein [Mucilaginibacter sp. L294]